MAERNISDSVDYNIRVNLILDAYTLVILESEIFRNFLGITSLLPYRASQYSAYLIAAHEGQILRRTGVH